jgi:hypothetical protein
MEESGEERGTDGQHRWIIDPLDGTTNFLHGIPLFAVSIGQTTAWSADSAPSLASNSRTTARSPDAHRRIAVTAQAIAITAGRATGAATIATIGATTATATVRCSG